MTFVQKIIFAVMALIGAVNLPGYAHAETAVPAGASKYLYLDNNGKAGMIISLPGGQMEVYTSRDGLTWKLVKIVSAKTKPTKLAPLTTKPVSKTPSKITYVVVPVTAAERADTRQDVSEGKKLARDFELAGLL